MKTGIKQGIVIGAAVAAFSGLMVQGALAASGPQPVTTPLPTVRSQAVQTQTPAANSQGAQNYVNGMINRMQCYFNHGKSKVTPQERQELNQMYNFMRRNSGEMYNMMGGNNGNMMGGFTSGNRGASHNM